MEKFKIGQTYVWKHTGEQYEFRGMFENAYMFKRFCNDAVVSFGEDEVDGFNPPQKPTELKVGQVWKLCSSLGGLLFEVKAVADGKVCLRPLDGYDYSTGDVKAVLKWEFVR